MSRHRRNFFTKVLIFVFVIFSGCWLTGIAHADEHGDRNHDLRTHEFREREFRRREFRDTRYHHDHYYPPHGYVFGVLPRQHRVVLFGGVQYFFGAGIWYRRHREHFIVVAPPLGVAIPILPPAYATIWVGNVPYYYANNVYYLRSPSGYVVAQEPPMNMVVEQVPGTSLPANGVIELGPGNPGTQPSRSVVVAPASPPQFYVYPRQGQNQEQQSRDRSECHNWAVGQVGSDPANFPSGHSGPNVGEYQRALSACLDGRGYTMR